MSGGWKTYQQLDSCLSYPVYNRGYLLKIMPHSWKHIPTLNISNLVIPGTTITAFHRIPQNIKPNALACLAQIVPVNHDERQLLEFTLSNLELFTYCGHGIPLYSMLSQTWSANLEVFVLPNWTFFICSDRRLLWGLPQKIK